MPVVRQFHEELEFDLRGVGVDLLDFWRGNITARALEVLIRHLPDDSAFKKRAFPERFEQSRFDYQAADLFDLYSQSHFEKPKPYPRPGVAEREQEATDARRRALVEKYEARRRATSGEEAGP